MVVAVALQQIERTPNAEMCIRDRLKSGRVDNSLLCELAAHPDFPRLMAALGRGVLEQVCHQPLDVVVTAEIGERIVTCLLYTSRCV